MYIYIYISEYIHMYMYIYIWIDVYICVYVCIHMHRDTGSQDNLPIWLQPRSLDLLMWLGEERHHWGS